VTAPKKNIFGPPELSVGVDSNNSGEFPIGIHGACGAGGPGALLQGAPEVVLARCTWAEKDGGGGELSADLAVTFRTAAEAMAEKGLRVLAFAWRKLPESFELANAEAEMTLVGLIGLEDPPRPEVADALQKCRDAGIAMGRSGTDLAGEAADMVPLDDNFASIAAAIEESRAVFANIRNFLTYILTSNVPELLPHSAAAHDHPNPSRRSRHRRARSRRRKAGPGHHESTAALRRLLRKRRQLSSAINHLGLQTTTVAAE
jgi:hypothetical protein